MPQYKDKQVNSIKYQHFASFNSHQSAYILCYLLVCLCSFKLKIKNYAYELKNYSCIDTEHFLLLCNSFTEHRRNLLAGVNDVLEAYGYSEAPDKNILQLLLYGNKNLPLEANRLILNATMNYIFETERFA